LPRLRFPADLDLAPLVRSFGEGRGSLIALSAACSAARRANMIGARNESRRAPLRRRPSFAK
jgi:hypothetical protein